MTRSGDFMRIGAPDGPDETWQERRHNDNAAKGAEVRAELERQKYGY